MGISWDWLISISIILALILGFLAKMTGQTVGQLLTEVREFIMETREDINEVGENVVYYE